MAGAAEEDESFSLAHVLTEAPLVLSLLVPVQLGGNPLEAIAADLCHGLSAQEGGCRVEELAHDDAFACLPEGLPDPEADSSPKSPMVSVAVRSSGGSSPLSRTLHPDGLSDSDDPSLLDPTATQITPSTRDDDDDHHRHCR